MPVAKNINYPCPSQVPEEEKNLGPLDRLIHVFHFTKETGQNQLVWYQLNILLRELLTFHVI